MRFLLTFNTWLRLSVLKSNQSCGTHEVLRVTIWDLTWVSPDFNMFSYQPSQYSIYLFYLVLGIFLNAEDKWKIDICLTVIPPPAFVVVENYNWDHWGITVQWELWWTWTQKTWGWTRVCRVISCAWGPQVNHLPWFLICETEMMRYVLFSFTGLCDAPMKQGIWNFSVHGSVLHM